MLLARRNRTTATNYLLVELWREAVPASGVKPLQLYIGRLRRRLGDPRGERLITRPTGYELTVGRRELDADAFIELSRAGRDSLANGDARGALSLLREALDLWRGPAFSDVSTTPAIDAEIDQLAGERRTAVEARFSAELVVGASVLGELGQAVREYPLSEVLRAHQMLGLLRAGQVEQALRAYGDLRDMYRAELQIEPSASSTALFEAIRDAAEGEKVDALWRASTGIEPRPAPIQLTEPLVPRQAPPDVPTFTGRRNEIAAIRTAISSGPAAVCAIDGPGGVGKTALVVHIVHKLAAEFPDGCLYVGFRGAEQEPLDVLNRFGRTLGWADSNPSTDLDEVVARFRSLTAHRRLLVVLDNVTDEQQVRPLLTAGSGCGTLVTSRRMLTALDVTARVRLDPLPEEDALDLLAALGGAERLSAERSAAQRIVRSCEGFPLALRIVAARMSTQPHGKLTRLADRLSDEQHRLDELTSSDLAVRSSFRVSYRVVSERGGHGPSDARVFRLLGLADCGWLTVPAVSALVGMDESETERRLERLSAEHLVTALDADRYGMHDLLRIYAREHSVKVDSPADRTAALRRLADWYQATARRAARLLGLGVAASHTVSDMPWPTDAEQAGRWLKAERHNLTRLVLHLVALPDPLSALSLTRTVITFLDVWGFTEEVRKLGELCLTAARRAGDRSAEAEALNTLGMAAFRAGDVARASTLFEESLTLRRKFEDRAAVATSLNNLGLARRRLGDYRSALAHFEECLRLRQALGDRRLVMSTVDNIGLVHQSIGEYDRALAHHRQALETCRALGDRHQEALVLLNLGEAIRRTGRPAEAVAPLCAALSICREYNNRYGMGHAMLRIGDSHRDLGNSVPATAYWEEAAIILGDFSTGAATDALHARLGRTSLTTASGRL
ncbi:AfsR/SARP family transcriptional regulator [Lentzea pudingi]|uniref:AfsR/SARP family transcriptional regulator n=1 Tax=Lentzea pudingi TaxID=1789439 RepID=UPI00166AA743|nr:BTAD domain-containing putative transcriptional regulator [Lentzea pudingi]